MAAVDDEAAPLGDACALPGLSPPRGLWRICLSMARRPLWSSILGRGGNGTSSLGFVVSVINPSYQPNDNVWVLVAIGAPEPGSRESGDGTLDAIAATLLDVGATEGYTLLKAS